MNNADRPASPVPAHTRPPTQPNCLPVAVPAEHGLTKRERFCLEMGVAATGDPELDAIIRAGNRKRHAAMAMQGILANKNYEAPRRRRLDGMADDAVAAADAILTKLEKRP